MFVRLLLCALLCAPFSSTFADALDPSGAFDALDIPDGAVPELHTRVEPQDGSLTLADAVAMDPCSKFGECTKALPTPVPEPGSILLLVAGLLAVGAGRYAARRPVAFS